MYIQPVSNTNFGKIGKSGAQALGRTIKGKKLQPDYRKAGKFYNDFKAQVKHTYNELGLNNDVDELCEDYMTRTTDFQNKFVKRH